MDLDFDDLVKKTNSSMMSKTSSDSFGANTKNAAGFVAILLSNAGSLWDTETQVAWSLFNASTVQLGNSNFLRLDRFSKLPDIFIVFTILFLR